MILAKFNELRSVAESDCEDKVKEALRQTIHLWAELLTVGKNAFDYELSSLKASRSILMHVICAAKSKNLFEKDRSFAQEIFRACFNLLTKYMSIFTTEDATFRFAFLKDNVRLLMGLAELITSLVPFKDNDLVENDLPLLMKICEHVDRDLRHDDLTTDIISLLWNLSDQTVFVPLLLRAGFAKSAIDWIKTTPEKHKIDRLKSFIAIVHNLSRHDDGVDQLNINGALDIFKHLQLEPNVRDNLDLSLTVAMTCVLLSTLDQIKSDSMICSKQILNMLWQLFTKASKSYRHHYEGFHMSESLAVLAKLSVNDQILYYILHDVETEPVSNSESTIHFFVSLLTELHSTKPDNDRLHSFTCVILFNILWSISCHQQYQQTLRDHTELIIILKSVIDATENLYVDTFMPRTMKSVKRVASDIFHNLDDSSSYS